MGVHLCGALSPRAISLFGAVPLLEMLLLVPCCLSKRDDVLLKADARQAGSDPHQLKTAQLCMQLEAHAPGVRVIRDGDMRTNRGHGADQHASAAKNTILVGRRGLGNTTTAVICFCDCKNK